MVLHKLIGRKERFPTPETLRERGVKSEILTNDLSGNPVQQTPYQKHHRRISIS